MSWEKTCNSATVKLLPSMWEPLFLTGVQGLLLSGGNTPWMSHRAIALISSRSLASTQPQCSGETPKEPHQQPGTLHVPGVNRKGNKGTRFFKDLTNTEETSCCVPICHGGEICEFRVPVVFRTTVRHPINTETFLQRSPAGAGETVHMVFLEPGCVVCSN